jgi:hypothetical protein
MSHSCCKPKSKNYEYGRHWAGTREHVCEIGWPIQRKSRKRRPEWGWTAIRPEGAVTGDAAPPEETLGTLNDHRVFRQKPASTVAS